MRGLAIGTLIWALAASWPGRAVAAGDGYMVAINCGVVPDAAAVEIVLPDNAPDYVAVAEAIKDALEEAGYRVAPGAPLRVDFDIEVQNVGGNGRGQAVDPADIESYREGQERVRVPLWTGQLRAGGGPERADAVRLTVMVHDKADGRCLWQGEANYGLRGADPWTVARRLVPFIVPHIGDRVDLKPIEME